MDNLDKQYNGATYQLYKESYMKSQKKWREKQRSKDIDENHKLYKRCCKIQPLAEFEGDHQEFVYLDGKRQLVKVPNRSCNTCRDRDKRRGR